MYVEDAATGRVWVPHRNMLDVDGVGQRGMGPFGGLLELSHLSFIFLLQPTSSFLSLSLFSVHVGEIEGIG